jgi:2-keto-4-pentenoate hydratase
MANGNDAAILKTPEEVAAWLAETEAALLEKIKNGPVVIG